MAGAIAQNNESNSERPDMCNDVPDLLIAQPFFPGGHGRDFSHEGPSFLDDQNEILIGHLRHVLLVGQRSDVGTETAPVSFTAVSPVAVASGAHLIPDFSGLVRVGLCRSRHRCQKHRQDCYRNLQHRA